MVVANWRGEEGGVGVGGEALLEGRHLRRVGCVSFRPFMARSLGYSFGVHERWHWERAISMLADVVCSGVGRVIGRSYGRGEVCRDL